MESYLNGEFTNEKFAKQLSEYFNIVFKGFKCCLSSTEIIDFLDEDFRFEAMITAIEVYYQCEYINLHPEAPVMNHVHYARQKRDELKHPTDGIREIHTYYDYSNPNPHEAANAYSKILDEVGYIFDTYDKIEDTVMDYFAGVNNLLWNITQEEACEVLGLDFNKAILLNIDCRDEASALLNEMFKETEYTDFSISPYSYEEPCRLEVVEHKDFWNIVDYFNEKRKARGGEYYV